MSFAMGTLVRSAASGLLVILQQEQRQALQDLLLCSFIQAIPYIRLFLE
jgi:hypothetical protein